MDPKNPPKKRGLSMLYKELSAALEKEIQGRRFASRIVGWVDQAVLALRELHRVRDVVKNNYELGVTHYHLGNFTDAVLRLKMVVWLEPKHADGWYWLGMGHLAQGKTRAAKKAFTTALKLRPDWPEARAALATASGNAPIV